MQNQAGEVLRGVGGGGERHGDDVVERDDVQPWDDAGQVLHARARALVRMGEVLVDVEPSSAYVAPDPYPSSYSPGLSLFLSALLVYLFPSQRTLSSLLSVPAPSSSSPSLPPHFPWDNPVVGRHRGPTLDLTFPGRGPGTRLVQQVQHLRQEPLLGQPTRSVVAYHS